MARVGTSVQLSRDPTGSPYFDDEAALRASLQALRDRTVPAAGTNAVLWTHQGRFNLAFGIWLPPDETVVFRPKCATRARPSTTGPRPARAGPCDPRD